MERDQASTWHASGLGAPSDLWPNLRDQPAEMTAAELKRTYPATYRKALHVCEEAHMNEDSTPAEILDDLVPILTDDKLKKAPRRAATGHTSM